MRRSGEERREAFKAVVETVLSSRTGKHWLGPADSAVLRTLLLLAAVDGEVSQGELDYFRSVISRYRDDVGGRTREALWESALHGAGFLILKGRFLTRDELIAAFVEEAEGDFVEALATGSNDEVKSAFDLLQTMAQADGTYSEMEGDCLVALVKRVSSARTRIFTDRFPHAFAT